MTNLNYKAIIVYHLKGEARKRKKPLSWFTFALKMWGGGYRFLPDKEEQLRAIEMLAHKLRKKLPELTTGQIVDILAEIVNAV